MPQDQPSSLKILHVLRAPVGGLFRHVLDLASEQIARGHQVGLLTDSLTGGPQAEAVLAELAPKLALGLVRTPIRRSAHWSDLPAVLHVMQRIRETKPDIVHGHGSKGGAFARLAAASLRHVKAKTAYTPHGGSFNYRPGSPTHRLYMAVERFLAPRTDVFLFESAFIQNRFHEYATARRFRERVVLNGIKREEFAEVATAPNAADFVYVGELRAAKGIDTLLEALALVGAATGRKPSAVLVGDGPDEEKLRLCAERLGVASQIVFAGRLPAREAFKRGRILVVPSRMESLPYVVLEAAGAHVPMIATNVGGMPEIFGTFADRLIPCDDAPRLAAAMADALSAAPEALKARAAQLADFVKERFVIDLMVDAVLAGYHDALTDDAARIPRAAAPLSIPS